MQLYTLLFIVIGYLAIGTSFANSIDSNALPTGHSAEIMKRMFGEVRAYSFQHQVDKKSEKAEKDVVQETGKLKDAVQQVVDNASSPKNSNSLVEAVPSKAAAHPSSTSHGNKKNEAKPKASPAPSKNTNSNATPKASLKDAGKLFDSVWSSTVAKKSNSNLRGSGKKEAEEKEEKHEADLKRSYDALDKSSPETKEALVETSEKTKTGTTSQLDAKEKELKLSENNPFYEKYSSTEKVPKKKDLLHDDSGDEDDDSSLIEEQQQQSGEPMTSSDKDVTMNTAETMSAVAAMNQPVAHPVNSAWNPLNQDHTPQALTYGSVPSADAPHMPASIYPMGSVEASGSVVPNPTFLAGSHGSVNSQYVQSPTIGMQPQQMSAALPGYNAGYQAGLLAARSSASQTALIEQTQQQQQGNKFDQGYQAGLAAAKYKAGYEAGIHALDQKKQQPEQKAVAAAAPAPVAGQQQRFVQVPVGKQALVATAPQVQPQQLVIKVVQEKSSSSPSVEKFAPAKVQPKQRLISKASLFSNNGLVDNHQQLQARKQKPNINRNENKNSMALLDVQSKSTATKGEDKGVYNGNYLASWPPPQGTQQHLASPLLGNAVAPAVPPPSPPQIGMAPAPPPASHISNTPDVLPQPTPPTEATDVRYGVKRFPDQSDAGSWAGGANTEAKSNGDEGEPLLNEPLMTPFGREDTQNAAGVMK
jgi:hypothetical protein